MEPLTIVAAVLVAVLGAYRFARVVIYDTFPPSVWLRIQWDNLTHRSSWNTLLHCPWCFIPWVMVVVVAWFFGGLFGPEWVAWSWWLFWGWLALSGLASMVYVRDERPER